MRKETNTHQSPPPSDCSALLAAVIHKHWTHGGTGITNFDKPVRPIYEAAIKEYGDPSLLVVDKPFPGMNGCYNAWMEAKMHSLHRVGRGGDLSGFWRVFEALKAANVKVSDAPDSAAPNRK